MKINVEWVFKKFLLKKIQVQMILLTTFKLKNIRAREKNGWTVHKGSLSFDS